MTRNARKFGQIQPSDGILTDPSPTPHFAIGTNLWFLPWIP
jgi:hypothetical protein